MNKNFTKADLKVGYVVKLRDGSLEMVMMSGVCGLRNHALLSVGTSGCWTNIAQDIDDNLCRHDNKRDYDIVEVYGYSTYAYCALKISTDDRELLWKREEKPAKKMTVAEIEKALGYKVEVVAEKDPRYSFELVSDCHTIVLNERGSYGN